MDDVEEDELHQPDDVVDVELVLDDEVHHCALADEIMPAKNRHAAARTNHFRVDFFSIKKPSPFKMCF